MRVVEAAATMVQGCVPRVLAWSRGIALLLCMPAALAADGDLALQVVVGAADTFSAGRWSRVGVTVSNRGARLKGTLELVTGHGDPLARSLHQVVHRQPLQLERDARKRFQFTVRLRSVARVLEARVLRDGVVVARRPVDLRRRAVADAVVLVLSRDADLDYLTRQSGHRLRVVYPLPERLPSHWRGYDAVRALVVHGTDLERLESQQYRALEHWIASGGTLVVSGGPNQALLRTPRLARLLPAVPAGLAGPLDPVQVGGALGVALPAGEGVVVNRVRAVRGEVLAALGEIPLLVSGSLGEGRIHYLTVDIGRPPLQHASALAPLWQRLVDLEPDPPPAPSSAAADHEQIMRGLLRSGGNGFPGHATLLYFLALYLAVLGTGARLSGKRPALRRLAVGMTLGAPVLFAGAGAWLFGPVLFPKGASAVSAALVQPLGDSGFARVSLDLGLYATAAHPMTLDIVGLRPVFVSRPAAGRRASDWSVQSSADGVRVGVADRGSYRLHGLHGEDVMPFRLELEVAHDGDALSVSLVNGSGRPLSQLWLLAGGVGYALGDLAAGGSLRRRLDPETSVTLWADAPWRVLHPREPGTGVTRDPARAAIDRVLFAPAVEILDGALPDAGPGGQATPIPQRAVLIGYLPSPLRPPGRGSGWRVDGVAGLMVHKPVTLTFPTAAPRRRDGPGRGVR